MGPATPLFFPNYAYINLSDQLLRVPASPWFRSLGGVSTLYVSGVKPDTLAKLGITVPQIIEAVQKQNTVNPAGQIGAEAVPRAGIHLCNPRPGPPYLRGGIQPDRDPRQTRRYNCPFEDVARIDLGTQVYNIRGRLNGAPAANIAVYQLPGTNAIATARAPGK